MIVWCFRHYSLLQPYGCCNQSHSNKLTLATLIPAKSGCDHARAPAYFAESITSDVGFYGTGCYSWVTYMIGWCEVTSSEEEVLFGENVPYGFVFMNRRLLYVLDSPTHCACQN